MLPLLFIAGPLAAMSALLWVRSTRAKTRADRVDRTAAWAIAGITVLLMAGWPIESVRSLFGIVGSEVCLDKPEVREPPAPNGTDIDQLKQEVRLGLAAGPPVAVEARNVIELSRVTGPGSPGQTQERWRVGGTDLGHPFVLDGRLGLVFGDTFPVPATGVPGRVSNVLAWIDERTTSKMVVTEMHESRPGQAGELLGSMKINGWEITVIPTNSITIDDTILLHWMSVACWGTPGDWAVGQAGLAVSNDGGNTFRRAGPRWASDSGFAQVAFVPAEDWVYVFGIPAGRQGGVRLARVPAEQVLDGRAWRYWDGEGWSEREDQAVLVVGPPVGELSVAWDSRHDVWLMMYLEEVRGGIVMRTSSELTGPWSRPKLVVSLIEHPQAYAPFLLPGVDDGPRIQFTMSRYDLYNVLLMEACLSAPARGPRPAGAADTSSEPCSDDRAAPASAPTGPLP